MNTVKLISLVLTLFIVFIGPFECKADNTSKCYYPSSVFNMLEDSIILKHEDRFYYSYTVTEPLTRIILHGVRCFDAKDNVYYDVYLSGDRIKNIILSDDGVYLHCIDGYTNKGILLYSSSSNKRFRELPLWERAHVTKLLCKTDNRLFFEAMTGFGNSGKNVYCYDGNKVQIMQENVDSTTPCVYGYAFLKDDEWYFHDTTEYITYHLQAGPTYKDCFVIDHYGASYITSNREEVLIEPQGYTVTTKWRHYTYDIDTGTISIVSEFDKQSIINIYGINNPEKSKADYEFRYEIKSPFCFGNSLYHVTKRRLCFIEVIPRS